MNWSYREPTLDEILSDSIIRALMEADGIDPQELAAALREVGLELVRGSARASRIQLTINATRDSTAVLYRKLKAPRAGRLLTPRRQAYQMARL
jgi:hypothetical protein